jgi:threonylcarbamoyladenosine tRNA methylthiotransferase MtaB
MKRVLLLHAPATSASQLPALRAHTISITTLGCRVNQSESEALAAQFHRAGYRMLPEGSPADVVIVNSCTVTHVADKKSRQMLRRAARAARRGGIVVLMGCYAEMVQRPERRGELTALIQDCEQDGTRTIIVPRRDRERVFELVEQALAGAPPELMPDEPAVDTLPDHPDQLVPIVPLTDLRAPARPPFLRTRALVKVQDGCDRACAFCIVPRARGRAVSKPVEQVLEEIRQLVAEGVQEVVLTGVSLGDYGRDWAPNRHGPSVLADLICRILEETEVPRVRLSSINPMEFDLRVAELLGYPRVCRHLHLPLQSGSDRILALMRRRHTVADYRIIVETARRAAPDVAVAADVIAGFPGETPEDHRRTLELVEELALADLHVFPFSPRRGTAAALSPEQVPEEEKRRRSHELLELKARLRERYLRSQLGSVQPVLFEQRSGTVWEGVTDTYIRVYVASDQPLMNTIRPVRLIAPERDGARGELVAAGACP